MTQSMTAFARVQKQLASGIFCWEIKSVNHRYLDVSFRLPEAFRFIEPSLRAMMRAKLSRGKLECQLKFQDLRDDLQTMHINDSLVNGLLEAGHQLALAKQLTNDLSLTTLLSWPGVLQISEQDIELQAKAAEKLFQEGLTQLVAARKTEGQALQEQIEQRLAKLAAEVEKASQQISVNLSQTKEKLLARLNSLQLEVDDRRIEQEIGLMLSRLDISEELDRLQTHMIEVSKALKSKEASGRRLDFLMQELNREANTLGSKSDSAVLSHHAVEMKVLIEQMREQIQNIE